MIRLNRAWKHGTNSLVLVLLVAALLVLVNVILVDRFVRLDLTEAKEFTLAPASRNVVAKLDDILTVTLYFSEKLPPYLISFRSDVKDLLDEYRAQARGKLQVKFVDPAKDPETEKLVRQLGIQRVQMNVIEKDQRQIINGYLGIAIYFEDRKEVIPIVSSLRNLEYDLTAAMHKVQNREVSTIGFLSTKTAHDIFRDYSRIRRALAKQYTVTQVNVADGKEVPNDVTILVLPGPQGLTPREKFAIDQYVMRGGRTLWLIDAVKLEQGLRATVAYNVAEDLLRAYGLRIAKDLVLDRSNAQATFNSGIVRFSLPYPYWPKVMKANFSKDHPISNRLESLVLPWTSPIEAVPDLPEGVTVTELARTTPFAWVAAAPFNLNPQQRHSVNADDRKTRLLAGVVAGRFTSFFKGKKVPPVDPKKPDAKESSITIVERSPETSMIVIGDSDFIADQYLRVFTQNSQFFLNAVDWLAQGEELIGIRTRGASERPLERLSEAGKDATRWLTTLAMPILVVGFGLMRFAMRRRLRRALVDLSS